MEIKVIDERSPHFETVVALGDANRANLGPFPRGAFVEYANKGRILGVIDANACQGYLLYRTTKGKATIAHLCIAKTARGKGYMGALVQHLIGLTKHLKGIELRCKRELPAYKIWPKYGFTVVREVRGRAKKGSFLTLFCLDHGHPDLFSTQETVEALDIVIDNNVFIDLAKGGDGESQGLLAGWLQDSIRICVTDEHTIEIDRSDFRDERKTMLRKLAKFDLLTSLPDEYQKAFDLLSPLFQGRKRSQDQSDLRQLARAYAGGAWAFVTRDENILAKSDEVYTTCGLSVLSPGELIGRIDELLDERKYQRFQIAGTTQVFGKREASIEDSLIDAIVARGEAKRGLRARLRYFLSNPLLYECVTIKSRDGGPLAFYVIEKGGDCIQVPLLRVRSSRLSGSLMRSILTGLTRIAAAERRPGVLISEECPTASLLSACADLGFLQVGGGQLKVVVPGLYTADALANRLLSLKIRAPEIVRLAGSLRLSPAPGDISALEHLFWPAKIIDGGLESYIVPIRAEYAQHLFDEALACQSLFGAEVELALNPESAYYRSAFQRLPKCPGRILWYVSQHKGVAGTQMIRACSRIAAVCVGKPKPLFKRFQRLGVYEWKDVFATAKKDINKEIMAIHFHDTELLKPVPWKKFQNVLAKYSVANQLQSPIRIPQEAFNEIYSLAFNSTQVRDRDSKRHKAS